MSDGSSTPAWVPRSLLPAELAAGTVQGPARRILRDWVVDVLTFCGAVLLGLVAFGYAGKFEHPHGGDWTTAAFALVFFAWGGQAARSADAAGAPPRLTSRP